MSANQNLGSFSVFVNVPLDSTSSEPIPKDQGNSGLCAYFLVPYSLKKKKIYLFVFRKRGREGETSMCGCLSHTPHWGTWPATQACALTGNRTSNPLVCRAALNLLSYNIQSLFLTLYPVKISCLPPHFEVLSTLGTRECLLHKVWNKVCIT